MISNQQQQELLSAYRLEQITTWVVYAAAIIAVVDIAGTILRVWA